VIVQRAPGGGIMRARVKGEMPMDEDVRMAVVFGFVDVFRRCQGKRTDGHGEHEPDDLTPHHRSHRMRCGRTRQLKTL
jgi:hypothetical protein